MDQSSDDDGDQIFDIATGRMDFDRVRKMYKEDPQRLEAIQKRMVQELIDSAPEEYQRKLRGMQFRVDVERRLSHNPMQSYLKLSELFWTEGFQNFQDVMNGDYKTPEPKGGGDNVISIRRDLPDSSL